MPTGTRSAELELQDRHRMEQTGHPSVKLTVAIYGRLVPGAVKSAADRLDSLLA